MINASECRRFSRLSTGPGYGVSFKVADQEITDAQLLNVSAGGCGLQVSMAEAALMETGLALRELYLDHPWLPYVPFEAQIVRLLGKIPGKTSGYVLVGVEFTSVTPLAQVLIQAHVEECLLEQLP